MTDDEETTSATVVVEDITDAQSRYDGSTRWHLFGADCPKAGIVFLCQVLVLYTIVVVSIYNLTIGHDDSTLWTALLTSSLGYLTLPSNASMQMHPENTLTRYVTALPRRIILHVDWECGLLEIQYPHSWYNVRGTDATFHLGEHDSRDVLSSVMIDAVYFYGTNRLMQHVNKALVNMSTDTVKEKLNWDSCLVSLRLSSCGR